MIISCKIQNTGNENLMTDGQHGTATNILLTAVNELVLFTTYCNHLTYLLTGMFVCLLALTDRLANYHGPI